MSDYFANNEIESKLSLVVRKPQEGKTFICITSITNDTSKNIHIVLTMNTLAAGMQFFGRMEEDIGSKRIVVFNSNKKTAGNCFHAKTVTDVVSLINSENIKVIVCCAHVKRIRESISQLFEFAADSIKITQSNIKFIVHIDEAHKYMPENIEHIRKFNASPVVNDIIGYSGTPDGIWTNSSIPLFHKILIRDVDAELAIIRSPDYFGVNRCQFHIFDDLDQQDIMDTIPPEIPHTVFDRAKMTAINRNTWFDNRWCFDLGNETLSLGFINHILPIMEIPQNQFSYHFVPAYARKATHYQTVDIILKHYSTANVIVVNGDGIILFRIRESTGKSCIIKTDEMLKQASKTLSSEVERKEEFNNLLEPSYVIQQLIKDTPNCPTFITGFTCVGMSVTLINQAIGNFDSVIMAHQHHSRDKLYQLCRFLFSYVRWTPESRAKIKTTKFYSLTKFVVDTCLEYEQHIERICTEFVGKVCTLRDITGLEPEEPTERELKKEALESLNPGGKLFKTFKVYDGNDEEMWARAESFYEEITGKKMNGKTRPHAIDGFWHCSTTANVEKQSVSSIKSLDKQSWWSTFQLLPKRLNYARIFVGYDNLEDPSEYTISIKNVTLEDTLKAQEILQKYGKQSKKSVNSSSSSSSEEESDDDV